MSNTPPAKNCHLLSARSNKYLQSSVFDITYGKGELDGFWFDHPEDEPIDGRRLGNVLRINGDEIPNGRFIPVFCNATECTDLPPGNR